MKMRTLSVAALGVLAVALVGCSSPAAAGKTDIDKPASVTTLKVMTIAGVSSNSGIHLGIEHGFFKDEGLELEITEAQAPPAVIAAVQGGQVDIGYATSIPSLVGLAQGVQFRAVMAADGYGPDASNAADPKTVDPLSLYATPSSEIKSYADLAGKRVAVPARKAQFEVVVTDVAEKAGVDASSIEWVTLDFQSALQALKAGQIDVASLVEPFGSQAGAAGMNFLGAPNVDFFGDEGVTSLWLTSQKVVDGKKAAIEAFQRAITKANAYANEHGDEAVRMASKLTGISEEFVTAGYWPTSVTKADLHKVAKRLVDLGFLKSEPHLDGFIIPQK